MNNDTIVRYGFNHGQDLVACNHKYVKIKKDMEYDEYLDAIRQITSVADEGYRQFSPFEFFAKDLNEMEDPEEAWNLYETAIGDGIEEELLTLTEADFNAAKAKLFGELE